MAYNQLIAMQIVRQQLERKMSQLKRLESQQVECNSQHKVSQTFLSSLVYTACTSHSRAVECTATFTGTSP